MTYDTKDQRIAGLERSAGFWRRATSRALRERDEQKRRADALERALERRDALLVRACGFQSSPEDEELLTDIQAEWCDDPIDTLAQQPSDARDAALRAADGGRKSTENNPGHDLYKTGDPDAPEVIKDDNGDVAIGLCRRCGRGEIELQEPCDHPTAGEQAQGRATITWSSAEDFDHIAGMISEEAEKHQK